MKQTYVKLFDENGDRVEGYYYDPETDVIHFIKSIDGEKVKFSTFIKRPNILSAKRYASAELRRRLGTNRARVTSLIKDELNLWLKVKESEGLKYDTMNNVRRAKESIGEFWGDKFPHDINRDNLAVWYAWFEENREGQMDNDVKYMRNFARYLAQKVVNGVPLLPAVPQIRDPRAGEIRAARMKKKERILTVDEFRAIYKAASSDEERVLCLILYTMATRITETLTMRFDEEIVLGQHPPIYRWRVGQNKANLWGKHALHKSLIGPLKALRERRKVEKTKRLFPQVRDNQEPLKEQQIDWQAWRERADIGWHWTPHTFRHTCLSNLFNDEKNPQALICQLYRVSLATAMEHYIKPTESGLLKMRDAIEVKL